MKGNQKARRKAIEQMPMVDFAKQIGTGKPSEGWNSRTMDRVRYLIVLPPKKPVELPAFKFIKPTIIRRTNRNKGQKQNQQILKGFEIARSWRYV